MSTNSIAVSCKLLQCLLVVALVQSQMDPGNASISCAVRSMAAAPLPHHRHRRGDSYRMKQARARGGDRIKTT